MSRAKGAALLAIGFALGAIALGSVSASFGGGDDRPPCTGPTSAPDSGTLTLQYVRASSSLNPDRNDYKLSGTMRWNDQAALDCFSAGHVDWAYEHEIRYDSHFDRKIWNENFGNIPADAGPYIDNTISDDRHKTTLSIGVFRPERLTAGVDYAFSYELFLPNNPPHGLHPLAVGGQVTEKNCSRAGPWCVGVYPAGAVGDFQTFVGPQRGFEVKGATCWAWRRGADPVSCPGTTRPTSSAPRTSPPATSPPRTSPPATSPPRTSPPATSPPRTSPPATSPPRTSPPATSPPTTSPPRQVTVYDTLAAPGVGEFTCSRNNSGGSSWAIQNFVVPNGVHVLTTVTVGVGARDAFTVSLRRGGRDIGSTRVGRGLDANIAVNIGRAQVNPGETLELWVGDAAGWTNGGTRTASHLFNVVRTQHDAYGSGSYRTTNNCPGQAPPAQTFGADMSARIIGWTR